MRAQIGLGVCHPLSFFLELRHNVYIVYHYDNTVRNNTPVHSRNFYLKNQGTKVS